MPRVHVGLGGLGDIPVVNPREIFERMFHFSADLADPAEIQDRFGEFLTTFGANVVAVTDLYEHERETRRDLLAVLAPVDPSDFQPLKPVAAAASNALAERVSRRASPEVAELATNNIALRLHYSQRIALERIGVIYGRTKMVAGGEQLTSLYVPNPSNLTRFFGHPCTREEAVPLWVQRDPADEPDLHTTPTIVCACGEDGCGVYFKPGFVSSYTQPLDQDWAAADVDPAGWTDTRPEPWRWIHRLVSQHDDHDSNDHALAAVFRSFISRTKPPGWPHYE